MAAINLAGRTPAWVRPVSGRLIVLGGGLFVLLLGAIIYGFHYRINQQERRKTHQQSEAVASDAATSNRATVENDQFSGLPVTRPELTPTNNPVPVPSPPVGITTYPVQPGYPGVAYYPAAQMPAALQQPDPAEQRRALAAARIQQKEQAAIDAPTGVQEQTAAAPISAPMMPDQSALSGLMTPTTPAPQAGFLGTQSGYAGQNAQTEKRHFQDGKEAPADDYLKTARTPPVSRWVIQRGTIIPAALPSKLVSDLPGDLIAEVVRDVYDSPTQKYVEIPAGSRLVGEYNSSVSYGQNRVQIAWTAIYFPDGSYIDLDRMPAHAADGGVGLKDQVDNHWKRVIGGVLISSLLSAGLQVSQNRTNGSVLQYPSTGQEISSAVGTQASELGQQITNRNLNIQPTLKIRPGEIFAVSVNKDMVFPGPYEPMEVK